MHSRLWLAGLLLAGAAVPVCAQDRDRDRDRDRDNDREWSRWDRHSEDRFADSWHWRMPRIRVRIPRVRVRPFEHDFVFRDRSRIVVPPIDFRFNNRLVIPRIRVDLDRRALRESVRWQRDWARHWAREWRDNGRAWRRHWSEDGDL
jgi:hypothetical protein